MEHPMMKCGHAANSVSNGKPACVICAGTTAAYEVAEEPDFSNRKAKCFCGKILPSNPQRMAFFQWRGEGSPAAKENCKHCRYSIIAHQKPRDQVVSSVCRHFEQHGAYEFDTFYCGCKGWD